MERVCNFLKEAGVYYLAQVLYIKNAVATFSSFGAPDEVVEF